MCSAWRRRRPRSSPAPAGCPRKPWRRRASGTHKGRKNGPLPLVKGQTLERARLSRAHRPVLESRDSPREHERFEHGYFLSVSVEVRLDERFSWEHRIGANPRAEIREKEDLRLAASIGRPVLLVRVLLAAGDQEGGSRQLQMKALCLIFLSDLAVTVYRVLVAVV